MGWGSWNPVSHLLWTFFLFRCHSHIEADIYRGSYWDPQLCKGCTALKPSQGLGSGEQHNQPVREHPGANSILTLALQVRKNNRVTRQCCSNFSHQFTLGNGVAKWVSGMPLGGAWGRWRQEGQSPRERLSSLATNYSLASLGQPCSLKASYPWTGVHGAKRYVWLTKALPWEPLCSWLTVCPSCSWVRTHNPKQPWWRLCRLVYLLLGLFGVVRNHLASLGNIARHFVLSSHEQLCLTFRALPLACYRI